jgi:hypothetical protein
MRTRTSLPLGLLAFLGLVGGAAAVGAGPSAEEVLKNRGLSLSGLVYVLDAEEDADLKGKMEAVKPLKERFIAALSRSDEIAQADRAVKEIDATVSTFRNERHDFQSQIDLIHRNLPRNNRNVALNSAQLEMIQALEAQRDARDKSVSDLAHRKNTIVADLPTPPQRREVEAAVQKNAGVFAVALADARRVVDRVLSAYFQLARDAEVKKALNDVIRATKSSRSLGPSGKFRLLVRQLESDEALLWSDRLKPGQEGGQVRVLATFNSAATLSAVLDPKAAYTTVSAELAEKIGLKPPDSDRPITIVVAKGKKVQARRVEVPSIRLGRLTFARVMVAVLTESEGDVEPRLGQSLLHHVMVDSDPTSGDLLIARKSKR